MHAAVTDIKRCINFIEEQTGAKWSWDAYCAAIRRLSQ